jgi:hypothetical protein
VRALYRGVASPLVGGALETAVNYSVYHAARRRLSADGAEALPGRLGQTGDALVAGAVAGVALSAVLGPTELVKCRVQAGGDAGVAVAVRRIWSSDGPRGFTRGLGATLAREMPGNAIFFATYEGACAYTLANSLAVHSTTASELACCAQHNSTAPQHLTAHDCSACAALQRAAPGGGGGASTVLCGGLAGMTYWAVVLPIDTAKTRMQVASRGGVDDTGLLAQLRAVYAQRGVAQGLYAGARPVMLRAFVANAVQWAAWESASTRLHAL